MRLLKLDAIDSTNDFLKGLSQIENLQNFTVVSARNQTNGRGQMGSKWISEIGKNLIMSVFVKDVVSDIHSVYILNICVVLAVAEVLEKIKIPLVKIKWPNDIMSHDKKIGGILIENSIKSDGSVSSIIGLGLNINQENFDNLPKASSLSIVTGKKFDIDQILYEIVELLKIKLLEIQNNSEILWKQYITRLFRFGIPTTFAIPEDSEKFMGIICGVEPDGRISIEVNDGSIQIFGIKEIQMLY